MWWYKKHFKVCFHWLFSYNHTFVYIVTLFYVYVLMFGLVNKYHFHLQLFFVASVLLRCHHLSFLFTHVLIAALFEIIDRSNPPFCTYRFLHIHQLVFVKNDGMYGMLKYPPPIPVTDRNTVIKLMKMEEWLLSPSCPPSHLPSITLWLLSWMERSRVLLFFFFFYPHLSRFWTEILQIIFFLPTFDTSRLQRGDLARAWGPFPWQLPALSLYIRAGKLTVGLPASAEPYKRNIIVFISTVHLAAFLKVLSLWLCNLHCHPGFGQLKLQSKLKLKIIHYIMMQWWTFLAMLYNHSVEMGLMFRPDIKTRLR